jgi:hypothetical protein
VPLSVIGIRVQPAPVVRSQGVELDSWQVSLEGHAGVVDAVTGPGARAGKQDRFGVQRRVAVRPDGLIAEAVESDVGIGAAVDIDQHRFASGEAEVVIPVGRGRIAPESLGVTRGAGHRVAAGVQAEGGGRDGVRAVAVLEVPDLAGEGDVVGVRCPDDPGLLGRGGVHGVEVVREVSSPVKPQPGQTLPPYCHHSPCWARHVARSRTGSKPGGPGPITWRALWGNFGWCPPCRGTPGTSSRCGWRPRCLA